MEPSEAAQPSAPASSAASNDTPPDGSQQAIQAIALAQLSNQAKSPISGGVTLLVIGAIPVFMGFLLVYGLWRATSHVSAMQMVIQEYTKEASKRGEFNPSKILGLVTYSASYETAMFDRLFTLLISYIIVFAGCIFVIGNQIAYYQLKAEYLRNKSALETSSPGLVLITLGCALVAVAMLIPKGASVSVEDHDGPSGQPQAPGYGQYQQQKPAGYGETHDPGAETKSKKTQ